MLADRRCCTKSVRRRTKFVFTSHLACGMSILTKASGATAGERTSYDQGWIVVSRKNAS